MGLFSKSFKRTVHRVYFKKITLNGRVGCAISKIEKVSYGNDYTSSLYLPSSYDGLDVLGILPKISRLSLNCKFPSSIDFIFVNQYDNLVAWESGSCLNFYFNIINNYGNQYSGVTETTGKLGWKIESYAELHELLDRKKTVFNGGDFSHNYDQINRERLILTHLNLTRPYNIVVLEDLGFLDI